MKTLFAIAAAVSLCVLAPVFAKQPDSSQWITPGCHEWSLAPETRGLSCEEAVQRFNDHVKRSQESPVQQNKDKCWFEAVAYSQAATYRDNGFSPQAAAGYINGSLLKVNRPMPARGIKKVVNLVYFDNRFQGIGSNSLFTAILQICLHPDSEYKPLK